MNTFLRMLGVLCLSAVLLPLPANARVLYSPLRLTIHDQGSFQFDLNRDRVNDFIISAQTRSGVYCGDRGGFEFDIELSPIQSGGGVIVSQAPFVQLLPGNAEIDASANWYHGTATILSVRICPGSGGSSGYLGLELLVNGQWHYAWAQISWSYFTNGYYHSLTVTMSGFAYETVAGLGIKTGQILGVMELSRNNPIPPDRTNIDQYEFPDLEAKKRVFESSLASYQGF